MSMRAGHQVAMDVPERVREALALRGQGMSWRAVARELGYSDHADIYQLCRAHDAAMRSSARWEQLTSQAMDLAQEAGAQLGEALLARQLAPGQLAVTYGIATDKVVNMRRAEIAADAARAPAEGAGLGALLGRLHERGGGKVTLEVTAPVTLDVSASESESK